MTPKSSDVVVTGVGVLAACGLGRDAFWTALRDAKSGIVGLDARDEGPKPPLDWRTRPNPGRWIGGPITGFDAAQYVRPRKALKVMGRELQTAFATSMMAMEQAQLIPAVEANLIARDRIATVFGSQMLYGPPSELLDAFRNSMDKNGDCDMSTFGTNAMRDIMPLWMLKYLPNMAACHVGISIGATGPNNTIVSGDVSATSALIESLNVLARKHADVSICGSTGSRIDCTTLVYTGDSPIASLREPVECSSRPHTIDSDGIVLGESSSSMVLELVSSAAARQVAPLALVSGASSCYAAPELAESSSSHRTRGSSLAISNSIQAAMKSAKLHAGDIGLVISHGMGDPERDTAERIALTRSLPSVPICMPVALTGHSGAATAGVAMVAAVLALVHRTIPATKHYSTLPIEIQERCHQSPTPLRKPHVMVLSHTSHGVANAVIFSGC